MNDEDVTKVKERRGGEKKKREEEEEEEKVEKDEMMWGEVCKWNINKVKYKSHVPREVAEVGGVYSVVVS